ncbi:MAG: 3'-5' exonuclease [Bacteroidetes bacterium]|uniref:3'-5' exonuclease n=1 Tax=Candidatus Pullibacteroides excrementavium TaxID=2840905 RepID=A0A9D9DT21_9BACT|nr:3'-5' exonuclease [Candidatus Pullibacteroides excrementavium]
MEDFKLQLNRPLCVFDLETTGLKLGVDRIIEIAIVKAYPDGHTEELYHRINPEMPIPAESTAVHHIKDQDVALEPTFKEYASVVLKFIGNSDLAGFNSNKFDVPMLVEEFLRVGLKFEMKGRRMIDVQNIFHKMEPRNLAAAVKFYLGKDLDGAHAAINDTRATFEVLKAQVQRYQGVPYQDKNGNTSFPVENNVEALAGFSCVHRTADLAGFILYDEKGNEVFGFGKHKGLRVADVLAKEPSYYDWVQKSDFPLYTKQVLTDIRLRTKFSTLF